MRSPREGSGGAPPANDIDLPSHLPPGGTFETDSWRVHRYRDLVEITHGLAEGDPVVTAGAFHLKSILIGKDLGEE